MCLSESLSRLIKFISLALFLTTLLVSQTQAARDKEKRWGRGGRTQQSNTAPTISGIPGESALPDSRYVFRPSASDADGDSLSFSIQNRPSWANFSSSTGRLYGVPDAADVGNYSNITISVSDGRATAALPAFSIAVQSSADQTGSVSLSWAAPTARSDGTPLAFSEIAGYSIHYGSAPGEYSSTIGIDDPSTTSVTIADLPVGTYHFVLTALDTSGQESDYSGVVSKAAQ